MSEDARRDDDRIDARAELLPEERQAGSEDPREQARAILEDSDRRQEDRNAAPGTFVEHRQAEGLVDPVPED